MRDPIELGRETIRQSAGFNQPFVLSNLAAAVIASAGLLGDSSAIVIGAMLVATLMSPIMGIGLALVDFDNRLLRKSLLTLVGGAIMVLTTGVLIGCIAPPSRRRRKCCPALRLACSISSWPWPVAQSAPTQ